MQQDIARKEKLAQRCPRQSGLGSVQTHLFFNYLFLNLNFSNFDVELNCSRGTEVLLSWSLPLSMPMSFLPSSLLRRIAPVCLWTHVSASANWHFWMLSGTPGGTSGGDLGWPSLGGGDMKVIYVLAYVLYYWQFCRIRHPCKTPQAQYSFHISYCIYIYIYMI